MAVFKCKMCGGSLDISDGVSVTTCEYCGTKQTVPKSRDEIISNLFNRANKLRFNCEFDKAEQVYEKILDIDNSDSEAHWGIVLCKYGIEYVEDPKTYSRIPTCHRTLYEAVLTDINYLAAIENADAEQKKLYVAEAKFIDGLQKDILNIVNSEEPFDVFLCYKETDENGKRTIDSTITNDIYYQLTQEGFKVFYAPITLEDKLGHEYEPYIFAALNSAKIMLVVGTKPEYFDSVWVRNEWSRFFKSMKNDRSKLLIPCYRDMDVYELPDEFAHLQAQDMSKIGFISDIIRGLKKVFNRDEQAQQPVRKNKVKKPSKIKKVKGKIKRKREERKRYCLKFPSQSLCTALFIINLFLSIFFICYNPLESLSPIFAALGLVIPLLILLRVIKNRCMAIILQIVVLVFSFLGFLIDFDNMYVKVWFGAVLSILLQLIWFVLICCSKKTEKVNIKRLNKIKVFIPSVTVALLLCIILGIGGKNFCDYQVAQNAYNMGFYEIAGAYFTYLNDYKNSEELALKAKFAEIKNTEIGCGVYLDGNWMNVVAKEENRVLLIERWSDLNNCRGSTYSDIQIVGGWKDSTLRAYLNKKYLDIYYSEAIKEYIIPMQLSNSSDPNDVTTDKIFVLSKEEVEKYNLQDFKKRAVLRNTENNNIHTIIEDGVFKEITYRELDVDNDGITTFWDRNEYEKRYGSIAQRNMVITLGFLGPAMWLDVSTVQ